MKDRVSIEISGGVADVRLVRADKMNALDDRMFDALVEAGTALAADASLRCVVLSGEGRAFCAGIDLGRLGAKDAAASASALADPGYRLAPRTHGIANRPQKAAWVWRELPVPVIAAVHGVAFGGGFQVMLGADMRYVAPDTRLSVMEVKWGLVPDMAGTVLMRELARADVIRELTYTGRIFSGEEALAYGFATRVCADPRAAAFETAREIAAKSPSAIEAAKRIYNRIGALSEAEALLQESVEQDAIKGGHNQVESVASQRDRRPARFVDAR
ncbi:MAG: crotonase/enoyl-CoA hydratase family protein [Burkholderiales bacterium]|nr:crotonase/enoyl-CoA hydratase family protein [Burkholderiales bacterium]